MIIAEDITSRFLNVIGLFNGYIPLIAIQMKAYKFDDRIALVFTKVLDEMTLGLEEDEEKEIEQVTTNRDYWTKKGSVETMRLTDRFLAIINETGRKYELSYTKANIRLGTNGQYIPFLLLKPRKKNHIVLILKITKSDDIDSIIENNDFDDMAYHRSRYRLRISNDDLTNKKEIIKELFLLTEKKYSD